MSEADHEIGAFNCGCRWHPSCVSDKPFVPGDSGGKPLTSMNEERGDRE